MEVSTWFVQDQLKGDNSTELKVKFIRRLEEAVPVGEDWYSLIDSKLSLFVINCKFIIPFSVCIDALF